MPKMPSRSTVQAGFSLIEILLVIGLIATIAIAAFVIYPRVMLSRDVGVARDRAIMITATVREFFAESSYTGLTRATAISAGVVDEADLNSPWGTVDINATGTGNGFRLDYLTVPSKACKKLVAALEPNASSLRIGSTFVKNNGTGYNTLTSPVQCDTSDPITVSYWPGT